MTYKIVSFPLPKLILKGLIAIFVILFFITATYYYTKTYILPIITFLILILPITNFFLPTTYFLENNYLIRKQLFNKIKIDYKYFKKCSIQDDGILLFKSKSEYEFIYIFNNSRREEIFSFLSSKINEQKI